MPEGFVVDEATDAQRTQMVQTGLGQWQGFTKWIGRKPIYIG